MHVQGYVHICIQELIPIPQNVSHEKACVCVGTVKGAGVQGGVKERYSGTEYGTADLVDKARFDLLREVSCRRFNAEAVAAITSIADS